MTALLETICAYQAGLRDFNRNAPEEDDEADTYANVSYGPHLDRLNKWDRPAETLEEAKEALRISVSDSSGVYGSEAATRMVEAALGYLDAHGLPAAEDNPTSLYRLLASYWTRFAELSEAMARTDSLDHDTAEREAAMELQFAAGGRLDEATLKICKFVPKRRFDAGLKARFISGLASCNGGNLQQEELQALLSSLPDLVFYQARPEGWA